MKQTVEEAAREYRDFMVKDNGGSQYDFVSGDIKDAFKDGAEWQAKQSPWISVEERLPPCSDEDLFLLGIDSRGVENIPDVGYMHYSKDNNPRKDLFVCGELIEVTHWMPIPTFDQVLEANKDVLQRIKEKEIKA